MAADRLTESELAKILGRDARWSPRCGPTNANQAARDRRMLINELTRLRAAVFSYNDKGTVTYCRLCDHGWLTCGPESHATDCALYEEPKS